MILRVLFGLVCLSALVTAQKGSGKTQDKKLDPPQKDSATKKKSDQPNDNQQKTGAKKPETKPVPEAPPVFEYKLTEAKNLWHFIGPAFKYRTSMKLMSDRLPKQKSIAAAMIPMEAGDNWNFTMNYIPRGEDKQHGEGFAIWFSQKEIFSDLFDFVSGEMKGDHVLGYGGKFTGFMVGAVINRTGGPTESYYFARTYDGMVTRDNLMIDAKICKKTIVMGQSHKIIFRYNLGAMALYIEDHGEESFCTSVSNSLPSFFLMLSGSALQRSSLSIDITSLNLETRVQHNIESMVTDEFNLGKNFFSLSGVNFMQHFHEFREFEEKKYSLYTEKFKTLISTTNKSEILDTLYKSESKSFGRVVDTLQLISIMAGDLKAMINYLETHEEAAKSTLSNNLDQVYKWIKSMDVIYDQIETDIDELSTRINSFQLETFTATVRDKLAKTAKGMMDYEFLSANVFQQGTEVLQFIKRLNDLSGSLRFQTSSISQTMKSKVERVEIQDSGSDFGGLLLLMCVILAIAGFFYFRVNRIHQKSHIL